MRATGFAAIIAAALALQGVSGARAQDDSNPVVVPPAPLIVSAPASIPSQPLPPPAAPPPGLVMTPVPPVNTDNGAANGQTGDAALVPLPGQAAPPANNWIAGTAAKLGVLDKIDGTVLELTIPAGGQASVGDLRIAVQSCMTRPPDEIPDAAVFLTAQNPADDSAPPLYRGWMVRSVPGAAVVGDTSETFRVIGCS